MLQMHTRPFGEVWSGEHCEAEECECVQSRYPVPYHTVDVCGTRFIAIAIRKRADELRRRKCDISGYLIFSRNVLCAAEGSGFFGRYKIEMDCETSNRKTGDVRCSNGGEIILSTQSPKGCSTISEEKPCSLKFIQAKTSFAKVESGVGELSSISNVEGDKQLKMCMLEKRELEDKTDQVVNSLWKNTVTKSPLMIAETLRCIIKHLPLTDLKSCRLVCHDWDDISAPLLRKKSRILLGYSSDTVLFKRTLADFMETFMHSKTQIPFTAFEFRGENNYQTPWPESELFDVFDTLGGNLKDLKIEDIKIEDTFNMYDMSDLLATSMITSLNITCTRKPFIWRGVLSLIIPSDRIIQIKYLKLNGCTLQLFPDTLISPVEVDMRASDILFPDETPKKLLNQFISFDNMKAFSVHMDHLPDNSGIWLDLSEVEMDKVDISNINIPNCEESDKKLNKMDDDLIDWL